MGVLHSEYHPLAHTDDECNDIDWEHAQRNHPAHRGLVSRISWKDLSVTIVLLVQSITILVLLLKRSQSNAQDCHLGQILYSKYGFGQPIEDNWSCIFSAPAQEALDFEVKVFTTGLPHNNDTSIYQEFTDEGDKAWGALYNREYLTAGLGGQNSFYRH